MNRLNWDEYFIEIASVVAKRGTCLRRVYGAVVTNSNVIISTGYCGAPVGEANCCDLGTCKRQELGIPSGERYELCRSVHAEMNAVISGDPQRMIGGTIYVAGWDFEASQKYPSTVLKFAEAHPCMMCSRVIKNARLKEIVWRKNDGSIARKSVEEL